MVRPIRGQGHAADEERTVEAPPEEPTLSAGLDVRAAFEAQDRTVPGAVVGLAPIEGPVPVQERTMPLVSPAVVREIQAKAQAPAPPQSQPRLQAAVAHVPLPPPSDPVLVTAPRDGDADAEEPVDIPGVGGAQRKRMLRIVIGVLAACGLLCVAAVARQLLAGNPDTTAASSSTLR